MISALRTTPAYVWLIVLLGALARLAIASLTIFHSDELQEVFAAVMILEKGLPIFPSGMLWPAGGPIPYLEAPMIAAFGVHELPARLPGVALSSATVWMVWYLGRAFVGPRAAAIAAFAWALDPDAVLWGAYARQYSLHPLLVLVSLFFWRRAAQSGPTPADGAAAAASVTVTVWTQPPTILWGPAFALAYAAWTRRVHWRNQALSAAACLAGVGAVMAAVYFGDPGLFQSSSLQGPLILMPNLGDPWSFFPWRRQWPFLTEFAQRRLLLIAALATLSSSVARLLLCGLRGTAAPRARELFALGVFSLAGSVSLGFFYYGQPGYGLALLIPIYLVGSAGLVAFFHALLALSRNWIGKLAAVNASGMAGAIAALCVAASMGESIAKTRYNLRPEAGLGLEEGYRFVRERWRHDDVFLNANPSAYLSSSPGSQLYYFCERNCGLGLMRSEKGWVDRMLGRPVLSTSAALRAVLDADARVWFVVMDREIDSDRYSSDSRALVRERMTRVFRFNTTSVYFKDR